MAGGRLILSEKFINRKNKKSREILHNFWLACKEVNEDPGCVEYFKMIAHMKKTIEDVLKPCIVTLEKNRKTLKKLLEDK